MRIIVWNKIDSAPRNGELVVLKFKDVMGEYEILRPHVWINGGWYLLHPPTRLTVNPVAWSLFFEALNPTEEDISWANEVMQEHQGLKRDHDSPDTKNL